MLLELRCSFEIVLTQHETIKRLSYQAITFRKFHFYKQFTAHSFQLRREPHMLYEKQYNQISLFFSAPTTKAFECSVSCFSTLYSYLLHGTKHI